MGQTVIPKEDILVHKENVYSQSGEDGIIRYIFNEIGAGTRTCCEFGAWDGVHLSNCRQLILQGWDAVMIESDQVRSKQCASTYRDNPRVKTVHRTVDTQYNKLGDILRQSGVGTLDFLSIDIDGPDYDILKSIQIRPRVICIEVNAGHNPNISRPVPTEIATRNVGQPLLVFTNLAREMGYVLTCYTGNAFFILEEISRAHGLPSLSSETAYRYFLSHLSDVEKEWLYLANLGLVPPYFFFKNSLLSARSLGIRRSSAFQLFVKKASTSVAKRIKKMTGR